MKPHVFHRTLATFLILSWILNLVQPTMVKAAVEPGNPDQPESSQSNSQLQSNNLIEPTPAVEVELQSQIMADDQTGYLIYFREKADLSKAYGMSWEERGWFVMRTLQGTARHSQARVKAFLEAHKVDYKAYWIDNVILVRSSDRIAFNGLLEFGEIEILRARRNPILYEPVNTISGGGQPTSLEPNITHVFADQVWGMGFTGQGIVVANIDTGVNYTHEALVKQYRGNLGGGTFDHNYNWYDPPGGGSDLVPNDWENHGSHTMGTMIGSTSPDDPLNAANGIGVAPGAVWIACQAFEGSDQDLLDCAEWMAAPFDLAGSNPDPGKRPNIINNSWGDCGRSYDPWFAGVIDVWHAEGIYPSFSNGNSSNCGYQSPPGLNTVGNPARYGNVTGVGATGTSDGQYAPYSNWGPTDNLDTINPEGYPALKPQVVAPGTNRSAFRSGNTYGVYSGTSMASPHVAGTIALMWSAAPCLVGDYATTETILQQTATPIPYNTGGTPPPGPGNVPNYATGWGEINALAAVQAAQGSCGDSNLKGYVTDATSNDPIAGAHIVATSTETTRQTKTDGTGFYNLIIDANTYSVEVSAFGYLQEINANVVVSGTTMLDFALQPAPTHLLEGVVRDATTGWPLYASIIIDGYAGNPIWTDPITGAYSVLLPEGYDYHVTVQAFLEGYHTGDFQVGYLTVDTMFDFDLSANLVTCTAPGYVMNLSEVYLETFESGFDGWNMTGLWNDESETDTCGSAIAPFPSPTHAAYFGDDSCDYQTGKPANGELTTVNSIILPTTDAAFLTMQSYEVTECNGSCSWDKRFVEVSNDNGLTWATLGEGDTEGEWYAKTFSLSSYTGQNIFVRFRFDSMDADINWFYGWMLDNIQVQSGMCTPTPGGLLVGTVSDENTGFGLSEAQIKSDHRTATTSVTTPMDPAEPDGFYALFLPAGSNAITASMKGGYTTVTNNMDVVDGTTSRLDFRLPAGWLLSDTTSLQTVLELGQTEQDKVLLTNEGGANLEYEILEKDRGFMMLRVAPGALPTRISAGLYSPHRLTPESVPIGNPLDSFLPQEPPWTAIANYPMAIMDNTAAYNNGLIYSVGGFGMNGITNEAFVFDPEFNSWSPIARMNIEREKPTVGFIDGLLYVVGGWGETGEPVGQLEIYDPETDTWRTGAPNPAPLAAATGAVLDDKLYVIGGCDMWSCGYDQVMVYDPASDSWSSSAIYPEPTSWNACGVIDGLLYCAGGVSDITGESDKTYIYDLSSDSWTPLADMPQTAWGAGFAAANGFLIVSGGVTDNFSTITNETFIYDPASDTWVQDASSNNVLYRGASACGFYRFGGSSGGFSPVAVSEVYPGWEDCGGIPVDLTWVSTTPITGTLQAGGSQLIDVLFDATQTGAAQPGDYFGTLKVTNNTPYGTLNIPITMTVTSPPTWGKVFGLVNSLGYCDLNPGPLKKATVVIQGASTTYTTTTDNGGYYQWWLDSAESPLTVTVYADGHIMSQVTDLYLTAQDQVMLDFELRWEQPCLVASQTSLAATLYLGAFTNRGLRLTNRGAGNASFTLSDYEIPNTNSMDDSSIPVPDALPAEGRRFELSLSSQGTAPTTTGAAPYAPSGDIDLILDDGTAEGGIGLGQGGQFVWFNRFTPDPAKYPFMLDQVSVIVGSTASRGDDFQLLIWEDADGDPTNGANLLYSEWVKVQYNDGYTWNTYTLSSPVLLKGPGGDVLVGVVNRSGMLDYYDFPAWVDYSPSQQRSWIGLYAGDPPDMPYLPDAYLTLIDDLGMAGNWTLRASGVSLPDAAWLEETPDSGTIPADSFLNTIIRIDANQVPAPGIYNGTVKLENNDPVNPERKLPVTLTVIAPASWGQVKGTITSLGYCDVNPVGLKNAYIQAEDSNFNKRWVYADASGNFTLWLNSLNGPYTLTITADEHLPVTINGVTVGPSGAITTQDVAMRLIAACLDYAPESFNVDIDWGNTITENLTFTNTGAGQVNLLLRERLGGFLPMSQYKILVVNDWGQEFNGTAAITQSLETLGLVFDVVNSTADGGIQATLGDYRLVIYVGFPNSGPEENALIDFLDQEGSLLLASRDMGEYSWNSRLYSDYLQASFNNGGGSRGVVKGFDIMKGLDIDISSDMSPDDFFILGPDSVGIFMVEGGYAWAGSRIERNDYRAIYLAWNYEYTGGATVGDPDETNLLEKALTWLVPPDNALTWLTATPITATLAADVGVLDVTMNFNAGDLDITQPGTYYGNLQVISNDPVRGKFMIPVAMNVNPPPGWGRLSGLIYSQGYCDQEVIPLLEASIHVEDQYGGTWNFTNDNLGNYIRWLDEATGPYTITVSADHHITTQIVTGVSASTPTVLDIGLRWAEPCISIDTPAITVTLELNENTTAPFTFGNTGAITATWSLVEEMTAFKPMGGGSLVFEENFENQFPPAGWSVTDNAGSGNVWNRNDNLGAPNRTADQGGSGFSAAADSGWVCNGEPWDTTLYSPILDLTNYGGLMLIYRSNYWNYIGYGEIWLDASSDGGATWQNLRHQIQSDVPEGSTEFVDLSAFNYKTIQLRWRYTDNGSGCAWFWHIDDVMILGLPGVDWLNADLSNGELDPNTGTETLGLTFDASLVSQPGTYNALLHLRSNDPFASDQVAPVAMIITPPPNWGKVTGKVTSLGYCDTNPAPLAEALVEIMTYNGIQATVLTDENGSYTWWYDAAESPLEITFSDPTHATETITNIPISAGETTTLDINLRLLASCTTVSPITLEVTLTNGMSETIPLMLTNSGLVNTGFELAENLGGFTPFQTVLTGKAITGSTVPGAQFSSLAAGPANRVTPIPIHIPTGEEYFITQSLSQEIVSGNSVACNNGFSTVNNSYLRVFNLADYGINFEIRAKMVQFGIETAMGNGGTQPVFVNLYSLEGDLLWENMTLLGSVEAEIADSMLSLAEIPTDVIIPANTTLVVEIFAPDTGNWLFVGANSAGQTGLTYLASADCSVFEPISAGELGFDYMHMVMNVIGEKTLVEIPWLSEDPITGTISFGDQVGSLITFTAGEELATGIYTGTLLVYTDDPTGTPILVPLIMNVVRYDGALEAESTEKYGAPGEIVTYDLTITNTGSGATDSYQITLDGFQYASWVSETLVGPLDVGESETVLVKVQIPEEALENDLDEVIVTMTSTGNPAVSREVMLKTHATFGIDVEVDDAAQTGAPGETLVYNLTITNHSASPSGVYQVSLQGQKFLTWASQTTFGPLDPGESMTMEIKVYIHPLALENQVDIVKVILTMTGNPLVTEEVLLTTHVTSPYRTVIYMPVIFK